MALGVQARGVLANRERSLEDQTLFPGSAYADSGAAPYLGLENSDPDAYTAVHVADIPNVIGGMNADAAVE